MHLAFLASIIVHLNNPDNHLVLAIFRRRSRVAPQVRALMLGKFEQRLRSRHTLLRPHVKPHCPRQGRRRNRDRNCLRYRSGP